MGKTLRADIVIGGKADSSFYKLGNALETLGSQINVISSRLIEYGKESVKAYASYEDYMLDTEVALRTQYESTSELGKVMDQLDKSALQWARDSRFTTEDVAGAISNAAHAGWNLERILNGVPSAMKVSLAGGMELSEGLEYLVDISNAAGIGFEDLGNLVDYWTFAANRSSTKIPEMGQAMQKMGATMQFVKGDMAGLTTMLAVLANNGAKGTEAGTLLRNSLIRLIAPTQKAAEAIDGLDLSVDDLSEIYSNPEAMEQATEMLDAAGFSAYDAAGNLKSFLTIFQELNAATSGMSEQDRNTILSAIFPTRTITGALALLEAAANDWDGLYDSIRNGSEGYADYAAQKMESGLGGTLRHLESVYNTLQTRTGKELSGDVSFWANALSGLIDNLNGMDDASFGALVSGLEAVAVAGPGLMVAGGAIKLIGAIAGTGPVGKLILLGTALASVAAAANSLSDAAYEDKFGNLNVDTDKISSYLSSIGKEFDAAQESISRYNDAVQTAVSDYETASSSLKENLLTSILTDATLTEGDKKKLFSLGDQMREALISGIDGSYSSAESSIALFADEDAIRLADDEDSLWAGVIDTLNYGYGQAIARAEQLSAELRSAMTSAFSDGTLSSEEINNIQSIINQQNELLAMQTDAKNAAERQRMLQKAQTLGLDALDEINGLVTTQRETELAALEDNYWKAYENTLYGGNMKIKYGIKKADGTPYTQEDLNNELQVLSEGYAAKRTSVASNYNEMLLDLYESTVASSELADAYRYADELSSMVSSSAISDDFAHELFKNAYGNNRYAGENDLWIDGDTDGTQIGKFLSQFVHAMGGQDALEQQISYMESQGNLEAAERMRNLYAMEQIVNNFARHGDDYGTFATGLNKDNFDSVMRGAYAAYSTESAKAIVDLFGGSSGNIGKFFSEIWLSSKNGDTKSLGSILFGKEEAVAFQYMMDRLEGSYDFEKLLSESGNFMADSIYRNEYAAYRLLYDNTINPEDYRIQVVPEIDETAMDQLGDITIPVNGDTTKLSAAIDAEAGKTLVENVDGDTSALAAAIAQYDGKVITISASVGLSSGIRKFAEGGRATEASVFGEAGPEWAIPEQHTQRTADLLNAARAASGFTWPELITRNGGLNAGSKGSWSLVYQPTIVAADASGVEQKLKEDKDRLEKWLRDKRLHDELEVYS